MLSHQVMARVLEQRIADYDFKEYEMPVNQMSGPHTHLADLALAVPFDTREAVRGLHRATAPDSADLHAD